MEIVGSSNTRNRIWFLPSSDYILFHFHIHVSVLRFQLDFWDAYVSTCYNKVEHYSDKNSAT